jgi:hypothetical protein
VCEAQIETRNNPVKGTRCMKLVLEHNEFANVSPVFKRTPSHLLFIVIQ